MNGGSEARYHRRRARWDYARKIGFRPLAGHGAWWLLHNLAAHPWLGIYPGMLALRLHDWTSQHLNLYPDYRQSRQPSVTCWRTWAWHNIIGHLAIGLFPYPWAFRFHDRTADAMAVEDWL